MSQFKDKSFAEVLEVLKDNNIILKVDVLIYTENKSPYNRFVYDINEKEILKYYISDEKYYNKFKQILLDLGFEVREN